jgi:hypothetical protein
VRTFDAMRALNAVRTFGVVRAFSAVRAFNVVRAFGAVRAFNAVRIYALIEQEETVYIRFFFLFSRSWLATAQSIKLIKYLMRSCRLIWLTT